MKTSTEIQQDDDFFLPLADFVFRSLVRVMIISSLVTACIIGFILIQPRVYESQATLFVEEAGNMVDNPLLSGFGLSVGTNTTKFIEVLLGSRTLQLSVAKKLGLAKNEVIWDGLPEEDRNEETLLLALNDCIQVEPAEGFVSITVVTSDRELSAKISNAMLDALAERLRVESHNRVNVIEKELRKSESNLEQAQERLLDFQNETGIIGPTEELIKGQVATNITLNAELAKARAELDGLKSQFRAPGDIQTQIEVRMRIANLEGQVASLEQEISSRNAFLSTIPSKSLEFSGISREILTEEKIRGVLVEQYKTEELIALRNSLPYRVIDRAVPAIRPQSRGIVLKTALCLMTSVIFCYCVIFMLELRRRVQNYDLANRTYSTDSVPRTSA